MFKPSLEPRIEKNLEFDAPQWVDLEKVKDESEAGNVIWSPSRDIHDIWFQQLHPLHEPETDNDFKSTQAECKKTAKDRKGKNLSLNISKPRLSSKADSSVAGNVSLDRKSLTQKARGSDDGATVVKKQRKCWNLDECGSLSFSPQNSTIPEDMLPKRVSSLTTNSCPMSPGRSSCDRSNADKSPCKPMRRSQKLPHQNDHPASPVKSTLGKDIHATKNINYQKDSLNKNKNTKSCTESVSTDIEKEFNEMIYNHNKRIMEKRAQYDENGRRIRKGNPETCPAPTEMDTKSSKATVKGKRRSVDIVGANRPKEAKKKRRSCVPLSSVKETSLKTLHQKPTTRKSTVSNINSHTAKSEETKTKGNLTRQTSFKTAPKSSIKLSNRYGK